MQPLTFKIHFCLQVIFLRRFSKFLRIDFKERERETLICCSTYLCIHWLILVCALTKCQPTELLGQGFSLFQQTKSRTELRTHPWCCAVSRKLLHPSCECQAAEVCSPKVHGGHATRGQEKPKGCWKEERRMKCEASAAAPGKLQT